MPTTTYNGQEVEYEDCTPSWSDVLNIHITVLVNPNASHEGKVASIKELRRMAELADKASELIQIIKDTKPS